MMHGTRTVGPQLPRCPKPAWGAPRPVARAPRRPTRTECERFVKGLDDQTCLRVLSAIKSRFPIGDPA